MATQRENARRAAGAISEVGRGRDLVVTHGNGPQVGALALRGGPPEILGDQTLDVLNAESAAMIGYVLEQELTRRIADRPFATVLTMVVVDRDDPAITPTCRSAPQGTPLTGDRARRIEGHAGTDLQ